MKAIIADDIFSNQMYLEAALEDIIKFDFIKMASNGQQVLDALEKDYYDVVFMDIEMPIMNGLEATKIIKSKTEYKSIPIIALTAHNLQEFYEIYQDVEFDSILEKPYNIKEIQATLEKLNLIKVATQ